MKNKQPYSTTNFYVSVWLVSRGISSEISYPDNSTKATFVFKDLDVKDAKKHIQEFYQDDVVQEFIAGIRKLKNELYANKEPRAY